MGFADKLKNAALKGLGNVIESVEKGKQIYAEDKKRREEYRIEQNKTPEQKEQEEKERRLQQKAEELKTILKPTCEKGDCCWNDHKFYFTCGNAECERKINTKSSWGGELKHPEFWSYMKRQEEIEKLKNNGQDVLVWLQEDEMAEDWLKEFAPKLFKCRNVISGDMYVYGIVENDLLELLLDIRDFDIEDPITMFELLSKRKLYSNNTDLPGVPLNLKNDFYRNKALYNRSVDDFDYTVKILETVLNPDLIKVHFTDTSIPHLEELFDAEGNVKPAGAGGPEAGFYGDTIWNVVEKWDSADLENRI